MDIWRWVLDLQEELRDNGHERLAQIIDEAPDLTVNDQHEQVEMVVAEGLALARDLQQPWLELFLGHWLAQSRILHRRDITHGMRPVIELLEFAHRDATRDCPQRVCVTQDVCSAYGVLDGPGYCDERLAASNEALAGIDASWPCFDCISTEYAEALIDAERCAEAERFCREQLAKLAAVRRSGEGISLLLVEALSLQSKHGEALEVLKRPPSQAREREHKIAKARELALSNLPADPSLEVDVADLSVSDYLDWSLMVLARCRQGSLPNTLDLSRALRRMLRQLRQNGSLHHQARLALIGAELAVHRGRPGNAALWLDDAEAVLPQLRKPEHIAASCQRLRAELVSPQPTDLSPADLLARLVQDPDADLELLVPVRTQYADDEDVQVSLAIALADGEFGEHAIALLRKFASAHPEAEMAFDRLLRLLSAMGEPADLEALLATAGDHARPRIYFYLATLCGRRGRWPDAVAALEAAHRLEPEHPRILSQLALGYRHIGRMSDAFDLLTPLLQQAEPGDDDWELMVVATALGRFDDVRRSAQRLGFQFESNSGPIDEPFEYCQILLRDAAGREQHLHAERISPVVARIRSMASPNEPSRYGDVVLFDPLPVGHPPPDAEGRRMNTFRPVQVLSTGDYRIYDLDGLHPGDEALQALAAALDPLGVRVSLRSTEEYELTVPDTEESKLAAYLFLAVPREVTAEQLLAVIDTATADWPPLTYRGLLRELQLTEVLERHEALADAMGIS